MLVIDRSEEIDIDLGIPEEELQETQEENKVVPNPLLEEMEEEETEDLPEKPQSDFGIKFKSEKEQKYYDTLTEEEREAWKGGWRGKLFKGFYKDGTPKPYKTAAEFLSFQREHTPVLNERNRKLAQENGQLESELAELRKQMQAILNVQKSVYEKETQKSYATLDEAEEAAILEGDVAKVRAIRKQREDLEKSKVSFEDDQPEPKEQLTREDKMLFDDWTADNTWFHQDKVMQATAATYFGTLSERIPLRERLEMVSDEIERRFSDKLGTQKTPRVESGIRGIQTTKKQNSYNDLPADVRKNCDFMAKRHGFTKEQIAKMQQEAIREYFN